MYTRKKRHPYRYMFVPMTNSSVPSTYKNNIGDIIKMYRMAHNLTQAQFASVVRAYIVSRFPNDENILRKITLRACEVSNYERSKYRPKIDKLTAITEVMGINPLSDGYEHVTGYTKIMKSEEGNGFDFIQPKTRRTKVKTEIPNVVTEAFKKKDFMENRYGNFDN